MPNHDLRIYIEQDLRPAYFDDFHCLTAGCRISCCKEWCIAFSKKDYLSLRRQCGSDDLNARMEKSLRRIRHRTLDGDLYAEFHLEGGSCPLQREDMLCGLQVEKGHSALPRVCRVFPRIEGEKISGFLERSLSPACEGVLALLWDLPEGVEFRSDPLPARKYLVREPGNTLAPFFQDIRSLCIDFLQDRRRPLPQRILLMGVALRELAEGVEDIPRWLERSRELLAHGDTTGLRDGLENKVPFVLHNNYRALRSMWETSGKASVALQHDLERWLKVERRAGQVTLHSTPYFETRKRYEEQFGDREYFMENLMVALFFHLNLPDTSTREDLWKSYVNFCNLYSLYHFAAVMSCREGAAGDREELFRVIVLTSRGVIHNRVRQTAFRDEFFQNDSATLAHMALLLCCL